MRPIDMTKVYTKYRGLWVAFKKPQSNQVIASGKTLESTLKKAQKLGYEHPITSYIPKDGWSRISLGVFDLT